MEKETKITNEVVKDIRVTAIWNVGLFVLLTLLYFLWLPPMNFSSHECWGFFIVSFVLLSAGNSIVWAGRGGSYGSNNSIQGWTSFISGIIAALLLVAWGICALMGIEAANDDKWMGQMASYINEQERNAPVPLTFENVAVMDLETTGDGIINVDTATVLIKRNVKLPPEKTSQLRVGDGSIQVLNGKLTKVYFLEYKDAWKWFKSRGEGIDTLLVVDASVITDFSGIDLAKIDMDKIDDRAEIITLPTGMKFMPSACVHEDLYRVLRLSYPTKIFGKTNSELDENGQPYWVTPVYEKQVGPVRGPEVIGTVVLNACTGEHHYYDVSETPEWVDNVYPNDLIRKQFNNYSRLQGGWWNSKTDELFVTQLTPSTSIEREKGENSSVYSHYSGETVVNYKGALWYYSGETSTSNDESNSGYILTNKRTKETLRFSFDKAIAEEYTAIEAVEKELNEKGYYGTFPTVIDIDGIPTYFFQLKDSSGLLLKRFALVSMEQHTAYAVDKNLGRCLKQYKNKVRTYITGEEHEVTGIVQDIRRAEDNGTTEYYINVSGKYYMLNYADNKDIVLVNVGDTVNLTAFGTDGVVYAILQ